MAAVARGDGAREAGSSLSQCAHSDCLCFMNFEDILDDLCSCGHPRHHHVKAAIMMAKINLDELSLRVKFEEARTQAEEARAKAENLITSRLSNPPAYTPKLTGVKRNFTPVLEDERDIVEPVKKKSIAPRIEKKARIEPPKIDLQPDHPTQYLRELPNVESALLSKNEDDKIVRLLSSLFYGTAGQKGKRVHSLLKLRLSSLRLPSLLSRFSLKSKKWTNELLQEAYEIFGLEIDEEDDEKEQIEKLLHYICQVQSPSSTERKTRRMSGEQKSIATPAVSLNSTPHHSKLRGPTKQTKQNKPAKKIKQKQKKSVPVVGKKKENLPVKAKDHARLTRAAFSFFRHTLQASEPEFNLTLVKEHWNTLSHSDKLEWEKRACRRDDTSSIPLPLSLSLPVSPPDERDDGEDLLIDGEVDEIDKSDREKWHRSIEEVHDEVLVRHSLLGTEEDEEAQEERTDEGAILVSVKKKRGRPPKSVEKITSCDSTPVFIESNAEN